MCDVQFADAQVIVNCKTTVTTGAPAVDPGPPFDEDVNPTQTLTFTVGVDALRWLEAHVQTIYANNVRSALTGGPVTQVGTAAVPYNNIYGDVVWTGMLTANGTTTAVGAEDGRFQDGWFDRVGASGYVQTPEVRAVGSDALALSSSDGAPVLTVERSGASANAANLIVGTTETRLRVDNGTTPFVIDTGTNLLNIPGTAVIATGQVTDLIGTSVAYDAGTFTTLTAQSADISGNATITTLTGTSATYDDGTFTTLTAQDVDITGNATIAAGQVTTLTGTSLSYADGTFTDLAAADVSCTTLAASNGVTAQNGGFTTLTTDAIEITSAVVATNINTQDLTVTNNADIEQITPLGGTLNVLGSLLVDGVLQGTDINTSGFVTATSGQFVNATIDGTLSTNQITGLQGAPLNISGPVVMDGTAQVQNMAVANDLTVNGDATITGAVNGGPLNISGAVSLRDVLTLANTGNQVFINGGLDVSLTGTFNNVNSVGRATAGSFETDNRTTTRELKCLGDRKDRDKYDTTRPKSDYLNFDQCTIYDTPGGNSYRTTTSQYDGNDFVYLETGDMSDSSKLSVIESWWNADSRRSTYYIRQQLYCPDIREQNPASFDPGTFVSVNVIQAVRELVIGRSTRDAGGALAVDPASLDAAHAILGTTPSPSVPSLPNEPTPLQPTWLGILALGACSILDSRVDALESEPVQIQPTDWVVAGSTATYNFPTPLDPQCMTQLTPQSAPAGPTGGVRVQSCTSTEVVLEYTGPLNTYDIGLEINCKGRTRYAYRGPIF